MLSGPTKVNIPIAITVSNFNVQVEWLTCACIISLPLHQFLLKSHGSLPAHPTQCNPLSEFLVSPKCLKYKLYIWLILILIHAVS